MNRRSVLITIVLALYNAATDRTPDERSEPQCQLTHEVIEDSDNYGSVAETYRFEELSDDAQRVFKRAVSDGSYATADDSLDVSEFRYWDTVTTYEITYENETYILLTYSSGGCRSG